MTTSLLFKWRHFAPEIIVCGVRWYLRCALSDRDVEELLLERGLHVDHTTVFRWVQRYAPEFDQRCRPYLTATNDSYRVGETYIKIKRVWHYLYRAVDSEGNTLDFRLSETRDAEAAKKFFRKVLGAKLYGDAPGNHGGAERGVPTCGSRPETGRSPAPGL
jgi:IS6 family transposase